MPPIAPRHRRLTPAMRAALHSARSQPLRRVHDGSPRWPAHPSTLRALERAELVRRSERLSRKARRVEEWWLTEVGAEVLDYVPPGRDTVRLLHVPGGSTRMMQLGTWVDVRIPEPERVAA